MRVEAGALAAVPGTIRQSVYEPRTYVLRPVFAATEAHAQSQGARELWLLTGLDNTAAQAFYHALDYADRAVTLHKLLA